jgi:hypothetical protein
LPLGYAAFGPWPPPRPSAPSAATHQCGRGRGPSVSAYDRVPDTPAPIRTLGPHSLRRHGRVTRGAHGRPPTRDATGDVVTTEMQATRRNSSMLFACGRVAARLSPGPQERLGGSVRAEERAGRGARSPLGQGRRVPEWRAEVAGADLRCVSVRAVDWQAGCLRLSQARAISWWPERSSRGRRGRARGGDG